MGAWTRSWCAVMIQLNLMTAQSLFMGTSGVTWIDIGHIYDMCNNNVYIGSR